MRKVLDGIFVGKNEIEITGEKLTEMFTHHYWNIIRMKIHDGYIDDGRLTWEDATAIMRATDILEEGDRRIPDDIIGEFAKRGYGEFYPDENKEKDEEKNHSED